MKMSEPSTGAGTAGAKKPGTSTNDAMQQIWAPFYAMVGAGDMASEAIREYLTRPRTHAGDEADAAGTSRSEVQQRLNELQERLVEIRSQFFAKVGQLPTDMAGWRAKLDPSDLRQAMENYAKTLQDLYTSLAARGEQAIVKYRQQAKDQMGAATGSAEERVNKLVADARELTDEMLGRMSRRTRAAGETTASVVENVSAEVADDVRDAGDAVAGRTRRAAGRSAARTESATSRIRRHTTTRTSGRAATTSRDTSRRTSADTSEGTSGGVSGGTSGGVSGGTSGDVSGGTSGTTPAD
jgi:heparin binding hemagglutinin HbhA